MFASLAIRGAQKAQNLLVPRASAAVISNKIATRGLTSKQSNEGSTSNPVAKTKDSRAPLVREEDELHEMTPTNRGLFYPDQMEWLDERMVRISMPTQNVMQSGNAYMNCWKIEFNSKERWEYWLMGWTSSADPVSNLSLNFPTKEAAIAFCERNELQWFVEEPPPRRTRKTVKTYAENFSWDKRTRLGGK